MTAQEEPQDLPGARILRAGRKTVLIGPDLDLQDFHRGIPVRPFERHRLQRHGGQRFRQAPARPVRQALLRTRLGEGDDAPGAHVLHDLRRAAPVKRRPQGEDIVKNRAERIDVGAFIHHLHFAIRLLGRHVLRCAHHRPGKGRADRGGLRFRGMLGVRVREGRRFQLAGPMLFPAEQLGQAPVHDQRFAILAEHDICRLQVAMDHPFGVGESQGVADLLKNREQRAQGPLANRVRILGAEQLEHPLQRNAPHQLHRVKRFSVRVDAQLMHGDDIRMLELRGDLRLLAKAIVRGGLRVIEHQLHRHLPLQRGFVRALDHAHAAAGHRARDDVVAPMVHLRIRGAAHFHLARVRDRVRDEIEHEVRFADPDPLVGLQDRRALDLFVIHERPAARSQIFDFPFGIAQDQPGMPFRDAFGGKANFGVRPVSDEIGSRGQRLRVERFVAQKDRNLRLGSRHERCVSPFGAEGQGESVGERLRRSARESQLLR